MVTQRNFEMFSGAGNLACRRLASRIVSNAGKLNTNDKLSKYVEDGLNKISEKHGEVWDTEPRNHIYRYANRVGELHGFDFGW